MALTPFNGSYTYKQSNSTPTPTPDPLTQLQSFLGSWAIGFGPQFQILDEVRKTVKTNTYPPYNIKELPNSQFEIQLAVAGFSKSDVKIESAENTLTISGSKEKQDETYIHKGLADRDFKQVFALAEDVIVKGASLADGILTVLLEREIPEHKKPKEIKIK